MKSWTFVSVLAVAGLGAASSPAVAQAPALDVKISAPERISRSTLGSRGLSVTVTTNHRARVDVSLSGRPKSGHGGQVVLGLRTITALSGKQTVRFKPSSRALRRTALSNPLDVVALANDLSVVDSARVRVRVR